jgi:hypothetical protein
MLNPASPRASFILKGENMATTYNGYKAIYKPNNKNAHSNGYVLEHRLIAEKILKKPLPKKVVIHHPFKNIKNNNSFVICENQAYHSYLHQRENAYTASGNPNFRKCKICKKYDHPDNLYFEPGRDCSARHRSCHAKKSRKKRLAG